MAINESDKKETDNSNKDLFKKNQQENNEDEHQNGLYEYNNLDLKNINKGNNKGIKNKKIFFSKNKTLGDTKINDIQKLKIKNNLYNNEEKEKEKNSDNDSENYNEKSFLEQNKDKIMKFKKLNKKSNKNSKDLSREKDKPISIKYKATSKIPNYLDLDIGTFGHSDCAKLVNFVTKNLEKFYSKANKVSSLDEYIRNCFIEESLKVTDRFDKKEQITIFQYFEITRKKEGDIFGKLPLQHNDNKRTATMITTKDSVFAYLSNHTIVIA